LTSTYQTTDGETHAAADVWFVADKSGTLPDLSTVDAQVLDQAIAALATEHFAADVSTSATPVDALGTQETLSDAVAAAPSENNLRSKVSNLAQALGAFDGGDSTAQPLPHEPLPDLASGTLASVAPVTQAVVSMADVMKQFDVNGNLVGHIGTAVMPLAKTLNLPGVPDPSTSGFLASGGK